MSGDPVQDRLDALGVSDAPQDAGVDPVQARIDQLTKQGHIDAPTKEDKGKFSPLQAGLHMATGALASVGAGYRGLYNLATGQGVDAAADAVKSTQDRFTTDTNATTGEALASDKNPLTWLPKGAKWAGNKALDLTGSPGLATAVETGINAVPMAAGVEGLPGSVARTAARGSGDAQAAVDAAYASRSQGAGAVGVDASKLTPETQAELARLNASGKKIDPAALERHADAETLPVPVRLTEGQAKADPATISDEFNSKGEKPEIGQRYNDQDSALQENLQTIHRDAAPTTVGNDEIQNGQGVLDSLKRYDAPKRQAITDAYNAAKSANGGDLQMDGSSFASNAEAALKPQSKARFLPSSVQGIIDDVKGGGGRMSLDDFESYRTTLANEVSKAKRAGDGNAVAAINKVRDALEDTSPADGTSAAAKGLYDKARGLAKSRFDEIKSDPAYEAAVGDATPVGRLSPDADKFSATYIKNGAKADLQQLRAKLDPEGQEAMTSSTMNYLKDQAGVNKGKFLQNGYNTALQKIGPRANELLGNSDLHEQLQQVGRVGKYTQEQTRGGYANNSHTLVAAAKAHVGGFVQDAANTALPFAKLGDKGVNLLANRARGKATYETLKPGAGLAAD